MNTFRILMSIGLFVGLIWAMRQAAGRLAPKVGIGGMLFLVSRRPVLLGWALGAAGMLALLLPGAMATGHDSARDYALMLGLSLFSGLGFAALVVGFFWMLARAFASQPSFDMAAEEHVVRELPGNHFLHGEMRGGTLLLTNQRLGFRPHRFNVQLDIWSAPLADIESVAREGTRFLVVRTKGAPEPDWIAVPDAAGLAQAIHAAHDDAAVAPRRALSISAQSSP